MRIATSAASHIHGADAHPMLISPAAILDRHAPGWVDLLLTGRVIDPGGTPIPEAILTVRGCHVAADGHASFEILTAIPAQGHASIDIRVAAHGYRPHNTRLVLVDAAAPTTSIPDQHCALVRSTRLADGTHVAIHDVVLTAVTESQTSNGQNQKRPQS